MTTRLEILDAKAGSWTKAEEAEWLALSEKEAQPRLDRLLEHLRHEMVEYTETSMWSTQVLFKDGSYLDVYRKGSWTYYVVPKYARFGRGKCSGEGDSWRSMIPANLVR